MSVTMSTPVAKDDEESRPTEDIIADLVQIFGVQHRELILAQLSELRELNTKYGPLAGYRTNNEQFASKLKQWIDDGERLFKAVPANVDPFFFFNAPNTPRPEDRKEEAAAYADTAVARQQTLFLLLGELRESCVEAIQKKIGVHGHHKEDHFRIAMLARFLCKKADLPLAPNSATSELRRGAGYIHEILTGKYKDLEHACRLVVSNPE